MAQQLHGTRRSNSSACALRHAQGFTLLELLVVLVIAGILVSVAALSITRNPRTDLVEIAQRLALLFESAADEAHMRAQPIAWQPTPNGYAFFVRAEDDWQPLRDDLYAPRRWPTPVDTVEIRWVGAHARQQVLAERVVFGAESIDLPVIVTLTAGAVQVSVEGNGNGRYTVRP